MSELDRSTYSSRRTSTDGRLRAVALAAGLAIITTTAIIASSIITSSGAEAKTPGKTYCYNRICHRVLTLAETRRIVGRRTSVVASYYSHCRVDRFNPCGLTSSGAKFQPSRADNAASPIYPNGTKLLVWNPANKRAAVVRIDNAGPYWRNRKLDLSSAAASKLGFRSRGVARLFVQVLKAPTRRQAQYRRHRKYPPVAGYIGRFASMASALQSTGSRIRAPRRRIAAANVVLPVRNTYLAERRIWLARMAEPRPITVAMAAPPKIRLPARLIRAALAPVRVKQRSRRKQRVAALTIKQKRSTTAKAKKLRRTRTKTSKLNAALKRKKTATATNANKVRTQKSTRPAKASRKPALQNKKSNAKSAVKPTTVATKTNKPVTNSTPAKPKPDMAWRQRLLGINRSGA